MIKKIKTNLSENFCFGDEDCKKKKRKSGTCKTGGVEKRKNARELL